MLWLTSCREILSIHNLFPANLQCQWLATIILGFPLLTFVHACPMCKPCRLRRQAFHQQASHPFPPSLALTHFRDLPRTASVLTTKQQYFWTLQLYEGCTTWWTRCQSGMGVTELSALGNCCHVITTEIKVMSTLNSGTAWNLLFQYVRQVLKLLMTHVGFSSLLLL